MLKHKFFTGAALVGALFLGSACSDWDDHYDGGNIENPNHVVNSNQTIKELLASMKDGENNNIFSDFIEVVEACSTTPAKDGSMINAADSLLNNSRVYTVWVPKNGSFDKQAYLDKIKNGAREEVFVRFVLAHMSDYMHAANGVLEDNQVLLLNKKVVDFDGDGSQYTFDDIQVDGVYSNLRVRNGIVHAIESPVQYAVNLYEYLVEDSRLDSLRSYLYSFDIREFNEYASIVGPTVNGEVTYIDSVFSNSNMWFYTGGDKFTAGFGDLSSEDSTYHFFAITNNVWNEMLPVTTDFYNFYRKESDAVYYDSVQHMNSRKVLCNYLVFSDKEQRYIKHPQDSMLAAFRYSSSNDFTGRKGEVRRQFAKSQLMEGVVETVELSNGTLYITDRFTYSPYELWFDTIKIEGELAGDYTTYKESATAAVYSEVTDLTQNPAVTGEISDGRYLTAEYIKDSDRPEVTYKIPNTLSSGKYRIAVVVVPPHITNTRMTEADIKPTKIRARVSTRNESGSKTVVYDTQSKVSWNGLQNDPTRIDTLYLYDVELDAANNHDLSMRVPHLFNFNYCERGLTAKELQTEITLTCDLQKRTDNTNFERSLRIDCIIIEPVLEEGGADENVSGEETPEEETPENEE